MNPQVRRSYHSIEKWTGWDLNPRPLPCQDSDLPADLPAQRPARKLAGIKRYPGGPQAVRARTRVSLESAFFGGMPNRSSFCTPRNFSPGISTGYTLVRQPKQMSAFGGLRVRTSPVMLRYPRESAPTNFETSSTVRLVAMNSSRVLMSIPR